MVRVNIGGSNFIGYLHNNPCPPYISDLRIGEAILLGTVPGYHDIAFGLRTDTIVLHATVLQTRFVHTRTPEEKQGEPNVSLQLELVINLGYIHTELADLRCISHDIKFVSTLSEHSFWTPFADDTSFKAGDIVTFRPGYAAMSRAFSSGAVAKTYRGMDEVT